MNRVNIISDIYRVLTRTGFYVSDPKETRSLTFDLICRRDQTLLIFKMLTNIDSFSKDNARQLRLMATMLDACPIVAGLKTSKNTLRDGVVYLRHMVTIINPQTLYDILIEGVYPSVFAAPGGLYVDMDPARLKEIRKRLGLSLGALAKAIGTTRKAVQMYEEGMSATLEVGLAIEEALNVPVIKPLNPLVYNKSLVRERERFDNMDERYKSLCLKLHRIGYEVVPLFKCPFDAFTLDDNVLFLTGFQDINVGLKQKAKLMKNIAAITERESVFFVNNPMIRTNIEGNPIISREDLDRISTSEEIIQLVLERQSGRRRTGDNT